MLKKELKRSARHNEDSAMTDFLGKDLAKNLDDVEDTKMEAEEEEVIDTEEITDDAAAPEEGAEDIPDELETDMEENPEETFKDVNEQVVVYLYRGFSEIGDQVRVFVEDTENEERDPELIETLTDFMDGYPAVMDVIKDLAKKYVTTVELFDPEEGEEVTEPEDNSEETDDVSSEELEDDLEDAEVVESYVKEHNLDHNVFESEYEIYARYNTSEEADKFEEDFRKFRGAEVFRHEDIGEVHAFVRIK